MGKFNKMPTIKGILTSHIFWAIISFGLVILFYGLTENDYYTAWKTNGLIISSISFVLFGLGAVGLSIFNLIIFLVRKILGKDKEA